MPLPGYDTFCKAIKGKYNEIKANVIDELFKAVKVCITADVWSARGKSFLGVSAHIIDKVSLERKSFMIALRRIKGRCTYDVLGKTIYDIQNEFGLNIEKLSHIVTDGGYNFCKMSREFGIKKTNTNNDDFSENIEEDNENEFDDFQDIDSIDEEETDETNVNDFDDPAVASDIEAELFANILDLGNIRGELRVRDEQRIIGDDIVLPAQMRCTAHLLNLIAGTDFDKKLPSGTKNTLDKCFVKLRRVWRIVKGSLGHTICEESFGRMLVVPNSTRWNSTYDAVKVVIDLQPKV